MIEIAVAVLTFIVSFALAESFVLSLIAAVIAFFISAAVSAHRLRARKDSVAQTIHDRLRE